MVTRKEEIRLIDCSNTADVSATYNVAGMVATSGSASAVIRNCFNTGNITTSETGSSETITPSRCCEA